MSAIKFLITGATSGLGGSVLSTLYKHISPSDRSCIAAASSRQEASGKLQSDYPGIQFRTLDFDDKTQMVQALNGVERFFFVSSPEPDSPKREKQHANAVEAAKEARVNYVYYASLAFGGYESNSKVGLQQAHLVTERLLQESGLRYTSVRMGVYTDAFPFFISWYPGTTTIYQAADGPVALTSREELGEATANLMMRDPATLSFKNNIALLTASRTYTFTDVVQAVAQACDQEINIEKVSREEFPRILAAEDAKDGRGGKPKEFFDSWLVFMDAIAAGEAKTVDPLMGELLGREPKDAMQHVQQLIKDGLDQGGYTWHQNYAKR
ncbi:hypothetical protein D8B26_007060 [Coccidioides posadasii str. Silveira]|uniref:NmrA-like domain-containing protein n=3 Tax=Coccidioides posadasii TaxID=199306 RepID=E9DJR4_COCPS|nr:NmrA-like family protein [Coccidioides posadasii C735 delta SOWgp]EER29819.1 NmrA-like family protein [Coccidioides posadasii C735 delta SOWgp]EFW13317.1 conserved hypothetical protein [Coccidioides posadasii str. Silveira]KMM71167.1 hypothetical protein CPAG_07474 [Coccidioides posadasii RMSCC 3488]QVM12431.1 hypothetical protein D8B26_007060 [Coccidioides posadasii str. Silveira]|eukprot:XP_003071964.1 NmrA-like family protein [Coccidioides posadasii C735 delta SOWgp]